MGKGVLASLIFKKVIRRGKAGKMKRCLSVQWEGSTATNVQLGVRKEGSSKEPGHCYRGEKFQSRKAKSSLLRGGSGGLHTKTNYYGPTSIPSWFFSTLFGKDIRKQHVTPTMLNQSLLNRSAPILVLLLYLINWRSCVWFLPVLIQRQHTP